MQYNCGNINPWYEEAVISFKYKSHCPDRFSLRNNFTGDLAALKEHYLSTGLNSHIF